MYGYGTTYRPRRPKACSRNAQALGAMCGEWAATPTSNCRPARTERYPIQFAALSVHGHADHSALSSAFICPRRLSIDFGSIEVHQRRTPMPANLIDKAAIKDHAAKAAGLDND